MVHKKSNKREVEEFVDTFLGLKTIPKRRKGETKEHYISRVLKG